MVSLVLAPLVLLSHSLFPLGKVGRQSVMRRGTLRYLDRGYRYLVTVVRVPRSCSRLGDYLLVRQLLALGYRYGEVVRRDGFIARFRYRDLIALVDDVQFFVADSVVDAYLPILPFRDNVPYIEFDGLVLLVHRDVPHYAPKHSAIIKENLDLFSAVNQFEPVYRQNERSAWGKHKFVVKGDGI